MGKINLIINGQKVEAESNQTILEIARSNGVGIPTLCHDDRLHPFGACRICLVEVEGARGLMPACTTPATDGMKIVTESDTLREVRKMNLELLLSDHPRDCLTCEDSGGCDLQRMAYALGVKDSRFGSHPRERKFEDANAYINRDQSKCILCGRCVRICEEVQGLSAIGFIDRGFKADIFPPFKKGLLDSDCVLCGQCVSTCPTGALTEKMAIGKGRSEDLRKVRTTCVYCGIGCQIDLNVHKETDKVVKITSRVGVIPNDGNLCVKGRFAYEFIDHPDRLKKPLIKRNGKFEEAEWDEALDLVAKRLGEIRDEYGPQSVACMSSSRCTNEENYLMQKFSRAVIGSNHVDQCAST